MDKSKVLVYIWIMIPRNIEYSIQKYMLQYPVIAIVGPRQSGKTTLAKKLFENYQYVSLESLDNRERANSDPRGFLEDCGENVILDEIQRVPSLFSYLQEYVDRNPKPARYILTGSHQFLLMEQISQSLAGRIITFKLFPFTVNEIYCRFQDKTLSDIYKPKGNQCRPPTDTEEIMLKGMYPRIHDKNLEPRQWIENYIETYIEKDVRSIIQIGNLRTFENFLRITAAYSGQLLNYAAISNRIGVSQPTIKKWLSILEASGIVFFLPPHYRNYSKRIVKTPKIFFTDSAVLCYLLSIKNTDQLKANPLYGSIFETFIIAEYYKRIYHTGEKPPLSFWRDKTGNEIDLLIEDGLKTIPVEIKSSKTFSFSFTENIRKWLLLKGNNAAEGYILYNGDTIVGKKNSITAYPWYSM